MSGVSPYPLIKWNDSEWTTTNVFFTHITDLRCRRMLKKFFHRWLNISSSFDSISVVGDNLRHLRIHGYTDLRCPIAHLVKKCDLEDIVKERNKNSSKNGVLKIPANVTWIPTDLPQELCVDLYNERQQQQSDEEVVNYLLFSPSSMVTATPNYGLCDTETNVLLTFSTPSEKDPLAILSEPGAHYQYEHGKRFIPIPSHRYTDQIYVVTLPGIAPKKRIMIGCRGREVSFFILPRTLSISIEGYVRIQDGKRKRRRRGSVWF